MSESEVSWKTVETGAAVVTVDGREVGRLREVVGDKETDIFDGLVVRAAALKGDRYIASERVLRIWPHRIEVDLGAEEARNLAEYTPPAAATTWRAGEGGVGTRLRDAFRDLFGRRGTGR